MKIYYKIVEPYFDDCDPTPEIIKIEYCCKREGNISDNYIEIEEEKKQCHIVASSGFSYVSELNHCPICGTKIQLIKNKEK